jgi:hypothetical protein
LQAIVDNACDNPFNVVPNCDCRDAQRADSFSVCPTVTAFVARRILSAAMREAVYLDRYRGFAAKEVEDIGSRRMLPAKLQAGRPQAQIPPQSRLWRCHGFSQAARREHTQFKNPTTMLRMVPLPAKSRGG